MAQYCMCCVPYWSPRHYYILCERFLGSAKSHVEGLVLLLGCIFAGLPQYFNVWDKIKNLWAPHSAE